MSPISIGQLAADLKSFARKSSQKHIERNTEITQIPPDELDVLCKYFPVQFITEMFGGNYQVVLKDYNGRIKTKIAEEVQGKLLEEEEGFEPIDPSGIGGWQYADRLRLKVFRQLESILNQGIGVAGHNQVVQAAKALLAEADKSKSDAAEVMLAYQKQLLLFAEHIVELFLPKLGSQFRTSLREAEEEVISKIEAETSEHADQKIANIWHKQISKLVREFGRKRFELMLAETMIGNKELSEALDFSKDLIETYRQTDTIDRDDKSTAKLRLHIQKRIGK